VRELRVPRITTDTSPHREEEVFIRDLRAVRPNIPTFILDGITYSRSGPLPGIQLDGFLAALPRGLIFSSALVQYTQVVLGPGTDTLESISKLLEDQLDQLVQLAGARANSAPPAPRTAYSAVADKGRPHFVDNDRLVTCGSIVISGIPKTRVKSSIPGGLCYLLSLLGIHPEVSDELAELIEAGPGAEAIKSGEYEDMYSVQLALPTAVKASIDPVLTRTEGGPIPLTNVVTCEDLFGHRVMIVVQFVPVGLALQDRQPVCSIRGIPPTDHHLCEGGRALMDLGKSNGVSVFPFVVPSLRIFRGHRATEWVVIMVTVGDYSPTEVADASRKICGAGRRSLPPFWITVVPTETPAAEALLIPEDFGGASVTVIEGALIVPIHQLREVVEAGAGNMVLACYAPGPLIYKEAGDAEQGAVELHIYRSKEAAGRPLTTIRPLRELLGPGAVFKPPAECVPGAEGLREVYSRIMLESMNVMYGYFPFVNGLTKEGKEHPAFRYYQSVMARGPPTNDRTRLPPRAPSESGSSVTGGRSASGRGSRGNRQGAQKRKCKLLFSTNHLHLIFLGSNEEGANISSAKDAYKSKRLRRNIFEHNNNFNE